MERREFVTSAAVAGAVGLTGCIDGEAEPGGNGTDGNETGNQTDGDERGPTTVTGTSFSVVSRSQESGELASYSFENGTLRVVGTVVGSDSCKTADLEGVAYDSDRDEIVVNVITVNVDDANRRMCAESLTAIEYVATAEYDGERPSVVVTHDGEEVNARERVGDETGGDGTALTESDFEVTGSECGTVTDEVDYAPMQAMSEDNESWGVVEGTLSGADSCTTAELGYVSYDREDDSLVADVRSASTDEEACADCVTEVDYRLEATFEDGVADSAAVSHDSVRVGGVGTGIETADFTVGDIENSSGDQGTSDADFNEDEGRIVVSGTIIGNDGCATARLAEAVVEDGSLSVNVETVGKWTHLRYCTEGLVAISYEATFTFDSEIPREASVSHDGTGVMSGAYASESASETVGE